ncbi:MAG: hypothetical protein Q4D58_09880 [Synergistaceae bacterium]|nr:hypothetical protein [Synergistaceae bacterium]
MTYIEKLMRAIQIDLEELTEKQKETFERVIRYGLYNVCPGELFDGAPVQNADGECESPATCHGCWRREAE